jgi:CBS domain-containing protein
MELQEVMTATAVTAPARCTVREVAELMRDRNVGCIVLVGDDGAPLGIVTDRDLTLGVLAEDGDPSGPAILQASSPVVTGAPDVSVDAAIDLMVRHQIRRLPVVQDGGVVGIVTLGDLASRASDKEAARAISAQVMRAALPSLYYQDPD